MIVEKVKLFIVQNKLFNYEDKLLLTLSGGRDSVALLHILKELNYPLVVAHCNFGLRNTESDEETTFVKTMCNNLKLPIFVKNFETLKEAKKNKESIQVTARKLRYEWFQSQVDEGIASKIVTAHHLDDQLETFIINLSRGTGIKGLCGIPVQRGVICRPMLSCTREEINIYLSENNIAFKEDSSNQDTKYLRNNIRSKIVPLVKKLNTQFFSNFGQSIQKLNQASAYWQIGYENWKATAILVKDSNNVIQKNELQQAVNFGFFQQFLLDKGFSSSDVQNIVGDKKPAIGKKFFSSTEKLLSDRNAWVLSEKITEGQELYYLDDENLPLTVEVKKVRKFSKAKANQELIFLDADKIQGRLFVRKWQKGDFFIPFGMSGKKKLSDFFTDQKINSTDKHKIWLLCDEKNIIWLMGLRMDNRYRISPQTKKIIQISLT